MRPKLFLSLSVFLGVIVLAYEVDNFRDRYSPLADAMPALDGEMNRRFREVEKDLRSKSCDEDKLYKEVNGHFWGWIVGAMEDYVNEDDSIEKHDGKHPHIYTREGGSVAGRLIMKLVGLNSSVNLNGHYVGADKLGHFINEGWDYFDIWRETGSLDKAFVYGEKLEMGEYGMATTGVKSYGDLAANYDGFRFWRNLAGGDNPYFVCKEDRWQINRPFTWADYVSHAWDEAINCSEFSSGAERTVRNNTRKYEDRAREAGSDDRYKCPVSAKACQELKTTYGEASEHVLSSMCRNATGEEPPRISAQRRGARSLGADGDSSNGGNQ